MNFNHYIENIVCNLCKNYLRIIKWTVYTTLILVTLIQAGCKKLVDVNAPPTSITSGNVFSNDATASAVLTGLYANLSSQSSLVSGFNSISFLSELSADNFVLWNGTQSIQWQSYYRNNLSPISYGGEFWDSGYPYIYKCNAAIEGVTASTTLTPAVKNQLLGEAKFLRAFVYFYLTNLYGDVPLALSTDYKVNSTLARATQAQVYAQIVTDLKAAESLLCPTYVDATLIAATDERVRPTKWAATALLARVYLYQKDWADAEKESSAILANNGLYSLSALDGAFLKNSNEAIWQLQPVTSFITNTQDADNLIILPTGPTDQQPVYLSNSLLNSFETGDNRKTHWIDTITVSGTTYYFPFKYKVNGANAPVTEYLTILRLGEQYLIRAEARAQLNTNLTGAVDDLNSIRARAGLTPITFTTQSDLLNKILIENRHEFFSELGHRWLDLKRTGQIDAVMGTPGDASATKGAAWKTYQQLYPIFQGDILTDHNLAQNPGY